MHQVENLKADKEVVLAAVAQDGAALQHASAKLKADKEVVLAAVAQNGNALEHASAKLKADKEVVLAAVTQNWRAWYCASDALKADKEVVLAAMAHNGLMLEHFSAELKADKEVVLAAVAQNGNALEHASAELKADKEVVPAAVAQEGGALGHASVELRNGGFGAYLEGLRNTYSVPVAVFTATVLFGSPSPLPAAHNSEAACAREISGLQKLNALGPEGAMAFKKRIAALAGVPCRELFPVPWSSVRAALNSSWLQLVAETQRP